MRSPMTGFVRASTNVVALCILLALCGAVARTALEETSSEAAGRVLMSGGRCQLPVEYRGQLLHDCLPGKDGQEWCMGSHGHWGLCRPRSDNCTQGNRFLTASEGQAGYAASKRRLQSEDGSTDPMSGSRQQRQLLAEDTPEGSLIPLDDFVQRSGTRFVVKAPGEPDENSCKTFYFSGFNTYYLMVRGANPDTRHQVIEILDDAKAMGLTVIRTWAFSNGPLEWHSVQRYPGVFDEATLVGLDFALHQASLRGIRVVLALANYWQHYGGTDQYNIWSFQAGAGKCNGEFSCRDEFFADPVATGFYKDHVRTLLNRKNTFNGRVYKDDPTIFGYNLMNEPRSHEDLFVVVRQSTDPEIGEYNITYNNGNTLHNWVKEMAAYVKSIDPVHLLSIGQEGFLGASAPLYLFGNPGAWASLEGNDFVRNHKIEGIDYATMHVYVDQWLCVHEGRNREGQMEFFKLWVEGHQEAAEEELQMPVVLEEFGGKLLDDKRYDLYKFAYDSCIASARRGGSCGGVMFWVLYHDDYAPMDEYGGNYGMYVPPLSGEMGSVWDLVSNYSAEVAAINEASAGPDTCVWHPTWPAGKGCRHVEFDFELGGLPWECLPGEAEDINFCNSRGNEDLYRNPPDAWKGRSTGKDLPFNTVETLVMGSIKNTGTTDINLKDSWATVPYSQGVHTKDEGVWIRVDDPNERMQIHCWYATIYDENGTTVTHTGDKSFLGRNLCDDQEFGMTFWFTTDTWPEGTKLDHGLRIQFNGDLVLRPGWYISGSSPYGDNVMLSFKENLYGNRLDVSSLELTGASECPDRPRLKSWPPPPPPEPPVCEDGKHPWRGCPSLEWYGAGEAANVLPVEPVPIPCDFKDCGEKQFITVLPEEPTVQSSEGVEFAGKRLLQEGDGGKGKAEVASISEAIDGLALGLEAGGLYVMEATVKVSGEVRKDLRGKQLTPIIDEGDLSTLRLGQEVTPDTITKADLGRVSRDAPNPEARVSSNRDGVPVLLMAELTVEGLAGPKYVVVAKSLVKPNKGAATFRGVFRVPSGVTGIQLSAHVPLSGLWVEMKAPSIRHPSDLNVEEGDEYLPCHLHPDRSPDAVILLVLDNDDAVDISMCSRGYDQMLYVFNDKGTEKARAGIFEGWWEIRNLKLKGGVTHYIVLDGDDSGLPYGSWRGGNGVRIKRRSGAPVNFTFDAAGSESDEFVKARDGKFYLGCQLFTFAGTNTWDLMDVARHEHRRHEIDDRLKEMAAAGLTVGRTWGFSLGTGLTPEERRNRLQLTPGVYDETVWEGLDYALDAASKNGIKIIISLEGFWLGLPKYLNWTDTMTSTTDFYTNWEARGIFRNHMKTLVNRKNSVNGLLYKNDPTILAYNLINEPRCTGCAFAIQAWISEMALYLKTLDTNHMVSVGEEGFYSEASCHRVWLNPGAGKRRTGIGSSPWALQEGQDFFSNHRSDDIDFATVHIWADNWMGYADHCGFINQNKQFDYEHGCELWREKLDYTIQWLQAHMEDARKLGKPMIVQEFGKTISADKLYTDIPDALMDGEWAEGSLDIRNQFFSAVYGLVEEDQRSGGNTMGTLFWNLYREGQGWDDPYHVILGHQSTFDIIRGHEASLKSINPGTCAQEPEEQKKGNKQKKNGPRRQEVQDRG